MPTANNLSALLDDLGEPIDPDKYDWSLATAHTLSSDELFQLTYAAAVEWGTEGSYLSLNITRDPIVRRFLAIWLKQEVVHGQLLQRLVEASGGHVAAIHKTPRQRYEARKGQLINRAARLALGRNFFAVHMAWGAVHELTTLRFYGLMRERTKHPLLAEILRDVMAQEAAHYAFYKRVAIERLEANPRGQRLVRWALSKLWRPVGAGLHPPEAVDRLVVHMLDTEPDVVASMDGAIERIPGMQGLHLVRGTVEAARARVGVA